MPSPATTVDSEEVAKFERMARDWWDPDGDFRPLHRMNPCRLDYVTRQIAEEMHRICENAAAAMEGSRR